MSFKFRMARRNLLNNISFYAGWWACAWGAVNGYPMAGPAAVLVLSTIHLYYSAKPKGEMYFFMALFALGFIVDSILIKLGLFTAGPEAAFAPLWLVAMWVLMGMTFEIMLLFRTKLVLVCLLGAILGPLTYFWGEALDIIQYHRPLWISITIHALLWAIITPLLYPVRDWAMALAGNPEPSVQPKSTP